MIDSLVHSTTSMGTVITLQVVGHGNTPEEILERRDAVSRAAEWFREINARCSRFDPQSELNQLSRQVGTPVHVSELLFQAIRFAHAVAEQSGGAFDPAVGAAMESRGFDRDFRTGRAINSGVDANAGTSFRDVVIEESSQSITLLRPLVLDLGAVAKGLAVDLAARELDRFTDFAIDAGGDLYLGGHNPDGESWAVGIRNPNAVGEMLGRIRVSNAAVCTSGNYERTSARGTHHHLVDPHTAQTANLLASVTVVAPSAMVADALGTAAFVLGPTEGRDFLERQGVAGLLVTESMEQIATEGFELE